MAPILEHTIDLIQPSSWLLPVMNRPRTHNNIEAAITAASDLAAFIALYDVPVDADGNPTGNAPINDWPDEI